jgi:hypothetical protein
MKLITEYDKDARLILCVFARKHEKQNRQLPSKVGIGETVKKNRNHFAFLFFTANVNVFITVTVIILFLPV